MFRVGVHQHLGDLAELFVLNVVLQQNLAMSSMQVLKTRGTAIRLIWNKQHNRLLAEPAEPIGTEEEVDR